MLFIIHCNRNKRHHPFDLTISTENPLLLVMPFCGWDISGGHLPCLLQTLIEQIIAPWSLIVRLIPTPTMILHLQQGIFK